MQTRYMIYMVAVAVLHMLSFSTFMIISGQLDRLFIAVPMNLGFLVLINLTGAYFIFKPIQYYLKTETGFEKAARRIHKLALYSAVWAAFLIFCVMFIAFIVLDALCPGCDTGIMAPFYISMMVLFCTFVSILIYFLVDDFSAQLKIEIFHRFNQTILPVGGRLIYKFIAAFVSVALVPGALAALEIFAFGEVRKLQGITLNQAFLFDIIVIIIMAGSSFYFIQKNLSRPIESLYSSMEKAGKGDLDVKTPILTDDEIGGLASGFNQMVEELRERDLIKETFGKYVPRTVAKAILENKGEFDPQHRLATILYADIKDFTKICENLSPSGVVYLLNEYFSLIVDIIYSHNGVVNQFQGDAVLVTFNVPIEDDNHAREAIATAVDIQQALSGHQFCHGDTITTRIGINSGNVVAGAVGADNRLNYTVHGDAVNTAARLESLNKDFGTLILVSDFTKDIVDSTGEDEFNFLPKGDLTIRGKSESVKVYEVSH